MHRILGAFSKCNQSGKSFVYFRFFLLAKVNETAVIFTTGCIAESRNYCHTHNKIQTSMFQRFVRSVSPGVAKEKSKPPVKGQPINEQVQFLATEQCGAVVRHSSIGKIF